MTSEVRILPATAARFDDVAVMVGPRNPAANVCWCLSHRLPSKDHRALHGPERRDRMRDLCRRDVAPDVLAY